MAPRVINSKTQSQEKEAGSAVRSPPTVDVSMHAFTARSHFRSSRLHDDVVCHELNERRRMKEEKEKQVAHGNDEAAYVQPQSYVMTDRDLERIRLETKIKVYEELMVANKLLSNVPVTPAVEQPLDRVIVSVRPKISCGMGGASNGSKGFAAPAGTGAARSKAATDMAEGSRRKSALHTNSLGLSRHLDDDEDSLVVRVGGRLEGRLGKKSEEMFLPPLERRSPKGSTGSSKREGKRRIEGDVQRIIGQYQKEKENRKRNTHHGGRVTQKWRRVGRMEEDGAKMGNMEEMLRKKEEVIDRKLA